MYNLNRFVSLSFVGANVGVFVVVVVVVVLLSSSTWKRRSCGELGWEDFLV